MIVGVGLTTIYNNILYKKIYYILQARKGDFMEAADSEITQQMMREAAHGAADVLRALANDDRLMLMCFLSQGEASVGQLEQALGIHQPTLSQQLAVMRRLKLVATRREGKQIFYRIEDPRILTLLNTLYALYCPKPAAEGVDHDD